MTHFFNSSIALRIGKVASAYFLVEGRRTEVRVIPAWLSVLVPGLARVNCVEDLVDNTYMLFSAGGYPSVINMIPNAIADLRRGKVDYLVCVLDADEESVESRCLQVREKAYECEPIDGLEIVPIVANRCFETWLLGNRRLVKASPSSTKLRAYARHYNVRSHDPELMGPMVGFASHSTFHLAYLKAAFEERGLSYSKLGCGAVLDRSYLNAIQERTTKDAHLGSFRKFIELVAALG